MMPGGPRPLTLADVQRANIDVAAQRALIAMSQSPGLRTAASGLAQAVQGGQLGGIYRQDQLVPAQRAQQLGSTWWQMLPAGQDFILLLHPQQPLSGSPVVAVRNPAADVLARLSRALADAWAVFEQWRDGRLRSCAAGGGSPFPRVLPILCRPCLGPNRLSPLARFIPAHSTRRCLPGDRNFKNCVALTERCIQRIVIHILAMAAQAGRGQTAAQNIVRQWQQRAIPPVKDASGKVIKEGDEASAHYVIDRDGTIIQMVPDNEVAFHVGHPNNGDSIGIEHADVANRPDPFTDQLYESSAALVRDIAARHRLPVNAQNFRQIVLGHVDIGGHGDPCRFWDWEYYQTLVLRTSPRPVRLVRSAAEEVSLRAGDRPAGRLPAGWSRHFVRRGSTDACASQGQPWGTLVREMPDQSPPRIPGLFQRVPDPTTAVFWRAQPNPAGAPATFRFGVLVPGTYKVSLWWPRIPGLNSAVPVSITVCASPACTSGFSVATRPVNQSADGGRWVDVGAPFVVAIQALVIVSILRASPAPGTILADGVRLLRIA
jgi:hypothetical protein